MTNPAKPAPTPRSTAAPTKTPLYQAMHASRYLRQALIRTIEMATNRTLLCYVSGKLTMIESEDTISLVELLHNVPMDTDIDLLLHTGGGDIDAAEKLVEQLRNRAGVKQFRIVVPDYAKSAGTLMVLGADEVVMSDSSELGPIDPQMMMPDGHWHSVQNYLDAYDLHRDALRGNPDDPASKMMFGKFDPWTEARYRNVLQRARSLGEGLLRRGMFRNGGNFSAAVTALLDNKQWQSHSQMISWIAAADTKIGLHVKYLGPKDQLWQQYWQLYCHQRLAAIDSVKLFESATASLAIEGGS
jgi:Serine dehydrogenase proteinase